LKKLKEIIDLRSDTVTLPTEEMLGAIKQAKLGDDVFREDPTVNRLEEIAAKKMGKEAALLVTSGTQANLVSMLSNTRPGDLAILEAESHIYWYEVGGLSTVAGVLPWPVKGNYGVLNSTDIENTLRPSDIHYPDATVICIENTHNRAGGTITTPAQIRAISETARDHGMKLYMDGARIFNAAVAMKTDVKEFTQYVDNLMFCLSKGLSCPVGSIVVGTQEFIERARRMRKMLGGGMRQAGIIAAPGIIGLEKMISRLEDDHRNARLLAEGLAKVEGIGINLRLVQTNILHFNISSLKVGSDIFTSELKIHGLLALSTDKDRVRMVTHRGIEREHIEKALSIVETVVARARRGVGCH
jgi:threonine aldolase